jgi:hypothetical protein
VWRAAPFLSQRRFAQKKFKNLKIVLTNESNDEAHPRSDTEGQNTPSVLIKTETSKDLQKSYLSDFQ